MFNTSDPIIVKVLGGSSCDVSGELIKENAIEMTLSKVGKKEEECNDGGGDDDGGSGGGGGEKEEREAATGNTEEELS